MVTAHVLAMVFSLGVVYKADKEALAWMRGKKHVLSIKRMHILHVLTWIGLSALVVTGAMLSYPMLGYLMSQELFIMKILFVAVLLVNAALIGRLMHMATVAPFASLSWSDRLPLLTSGAVSSFAWLSALILALVLFS